MLKCYKEDCAKSAPADTLYRVNEKGVPGIWACLEHRNPNTVDETLDKIVATIEQAERSAEKK